MQLRFIGCGDAVSSGGRFNTCFLVTASHCRFLIDCGAAYRDLAPRLAAPAFKAWGAKRVILTHMSPDMLGRRSTLAHETASDGMVVIL